MQRTSTLSGGEPHFVAALGALCSIRASDLPNSQLISMAVCRCVLLADVQKVAAGGETEIPDNRPVENLVPELTAQPAIEDMENTKKLEGTGTQQPCGRVVGIIRRNWREKQYCGSLRVEGDRAVTSGKGQATSALFMPVDRKVSLAGCTMPLEVYFYRLLYLQCFVR